MKWIMQKIFFKNVPFAITPRVSVMYGLVHWDVKWIKSDYLFSLVVSYSFAQEKNNFVWKGGARKVLEKQLKMKFTPSPCTTNILPNITQVSQLLSLHISHCKMSICHETNIKMWPNNETELQNFENNNP